MTVEAAPRGERRRSPGGRRGRRLGLDVTGVVGELMVTAGVFLLAFVAWQLWWTDVEGNRAQAEIVESLDWAPVPTAEPAAPAVDPRRDAPPVLAEPEHAVTFATLLVPRWGADYERPVSEGVDRAGVLDPLGIGHYPGTAMAGDVGNFSISGHRTTYGKPFNRITELVEGDAVVVRTADTWYVYRVTTTEIVSPSDVRVIGPVPADPAAVATERLITLTTCHPMYSAQQRYVVHGVLDYWLPTTAGFPVEITGGA
ncbi:class E sortase [Pengzhenrongella sicca]|uniref:Class E sortase n=1 Tax=Pengzhenrongella sicca TaxID=2819238 RepID=A0A8A4ZC03_9MICO|nr:class E sortase [Pengzhenrongella sicca]QTE29520.1 class E sortase [Pengzhenrongella sicca]